MPKTKTSKYVVITMHNGDENMTFTLYDTPQLEDIAGELIGKLDTFVSDKTIENNLQSDIPLLNEAGEEIGWFESNIPTEKLKFFYDEE